MVNTLIRDRMSDDKDVSKLGGHIDDLAARAFWVQHYLGAMAYGYSEHNARRTATEKLQLHLRLIKHEQGDE